MPFTSTNDDDDHLTQLMDAAQAGDQTAMNEVLRTLHADLTRYCHAAVKRSQGNYMSADDALQETLLGIYQALTTRTTRPRCPKSFSRAVARNKTHDLHRRATREQRTQFDEAPEPADQNPDPETIAIRNEHSHELGERLRNDLVDYQRDVLLLRQVAGYSAAKTATRLGTTAGAVRVTQNRALRNLRNLRNLSDTATAETA